MELRHLRCFAAIAEEGGFSKAARRLCVAQPALSRTIRDLEGEIGARLFERDGRPVRLTGAGEVFLDRARLVLAEAARAVEEARRAAAGEAGRLSVAFIGTLGQEYLPGLLQSYRERVPGVALELHEMSPGEQLLRLSDGTVDVGFLGMADEEPGAPLRIECLFEEPLVAAVPAGHRLAKRRSLDLSLLKGEPFLLTARRQSPAYNHWLLGLCRKAGFEPEIVREVDRAATVLTFIAAGFGVSVFPAQIARHPVPGVAFIPSAPDTPRYRYCVGSRRADQSEAARLFLELARSRAAALRGS